MKANYCFLSLSYVILSLFFVQKLTCQESLDQVYTLDDNDSIRICKWKNDAKTCIIFSFDDNNKTSNRISKIFDSFNYKATFFIYPKTMLVDSVKDIISRGHEIGNHTYSHQYFNQIDSAEIEKEVVDGKNIIESAYKIKCLSFAEPGKIITDYGKSIVFKNHLFARNYSEYPNIDRLFFSSTQQKMSSFNNFVEGTINNGKIINIVSHGLDGDGYMPITTQSLLESLELTKKLDDSRLVWVTTIKEGICYENIYREILLDKTIEDNIIRLEIKNFNATKYKDMDSVMLSINIPQIICNKVISRNWRITTSEIDKGTILNLDLKKDTSIVLIMDDKQQWLIEKPNSITQSKKRLDISILPNPFDNIVSVKGVESGSQISIYDINGVNQGVYYENTIDTKKLNKGLYVFRLFNSSDSTIHNFKMLKK